MLIIYIIDAYKENYWSYPAIKDIFVTKSLFFYFLMSISCFKNPFHNSIGRIVVKYNNQNHGQPFEISLLEKNTSTTKLLSYKNIMIIKN